MRYSCLIVMFEEAIYIAYSLCMSRSMATKYTADTAVWLGSHLLSPLFSYAAVWLGSHLLFPLFSYACCQRQVKRSNVSCVYAQAVRCSGTPRCSHQPPSWAPRLGRCCGCPDRESQTGTLPQHMSCRHQLLTAHSVRHLTGCKLLTACHCCATILASLEYIRLQHCACGTAIQHHFWVLLSTVSMSSLYRNCACIS